MFSKRKFILFSILIALIVLSAFLLFFKIQNKEPGETRNKAIKIDSGVIQKIENNKIVLSIKILEEPVIFLKKNNKGQDSFIYKTYLLNENTEIYKITKKIKSVSEFQKEENEYNDFIRKGKHPLGAPSWFVTQKIKPLNLKVGEKAKIYFVETNNGKIAKKIIASPIDLMDYSLPNDFNPKNKQIKIIGKLLNVSADKLELVTFNFDQRQAEPLTSSTTNILFNINQDIEVIKKIVKTEERFYKEQEEYNKWLKKKTETKIAPPTWYEIQRIDLKELQKGQIIEVWGKNTGGELFATRIEFIAK